MIGLRAELVSFLQRRGQSLEDAEDIVQETFARFHRAGHEFGQADARPLLFAIAKNLLKDHWKQASRERARTMRLDTDDTTSAWENAPSEDAEPPIAARSPARTWPVSPPPSAPCPRAAATLSCSIASRISAIARSPIAWVFRSAWWKSTWPRRYDG
jgi:hypothetical protein